MSSFHDILRKIKSVVNIYIEEPILFYNINHSHYSQICVLYMLES